MREKALALLKAGTVIPATPLCLDAERKFNEKAQRRLIRYYLKAGVGGLAVAVHTTQFEIRKPEINLLKPVLRIACEEAKRFEAETGKTIILIAGACGPIEQAVREAELARDVGYDAVLLSPGGLAACDEEYLIKRTAAVAGVLPVVGFYLQPSVGGRVFSYDYWHRVCETENVVAIKAAPFNRYLTADVARAVACSSRKEEIALYTGNDDSIITDLITPYVFEENGERREVRFVGGLLGHWAVWTNTVVKIFEKLKAEAGTGAVNPAWLTLAAQVTDCNSAFFDTANNFAGCIAGVHEVLRRQGLMEGIWCLNPDETLSPGQVEEIDRVYRMYPELNDDAFVRTFLADENS
ncbi:MAG: dihydrodipicolinate synthase family protein [Oscillospiraceae bacterium]|nr:dihydrodipicolinate synthase family protein [Oscillospiraceae bacterium]